MKAIYVIFALCLLSAAVYAQPMVEPADIQISYDDGDTWTGASAYVSDLSISVGVVPQSTGVVYAVRGAVMSWASQLGTPFTDRRVDWKLNTGLLPASVQTFRLRMRWAAQNGDGSFTYADWSEPSDPVGLIEPAGKPTVVIFIAP